jgi:hypothetical protein
VARSATLRRIVLDPNQPLLSRFDVHCDENVNNAACQSDLPSFADFAALREAIEVRGLGPTLRRF